MKLNNSLLILVILHSLSLIGLENPRSATAYETATLLTPSELVLAGLMGLQTDSKPPTESLNIPIEQSTQLIIEPISKNKSTKKKSVNEFFYECTECPKKYRSRSTLYSHMRLHSKEKRFECPICSKFSTNKNTHENHLRKHTGERPFKCSICEQRFSQQSNCNAHMKKFHKLINVIYKQKQSQSLE